MAISHPVRVSQSNVALCETDDDNDTDGFFFFGGIPWTKRDVGVEVDVPYLGCANNVDDRSSCNKRIYHLMSNEAAKFLNKMKYCRNFLSKLLS